MFSGSAYQFWLLCYAPAPVSDAEFRRKDKIVQSFLAGFGYNSAVMF